MNILAMALGLSLFLIGLAVLVGTVFGIALAISTAHYWWLLLVPIAIFIGSLLCIIGMELPDNHL